MASRIKEIAEFSKLFKVKIPLEDEFDYYISTLQKSAGFKQLGEWMEIFSAFEDFLGEGLVSAFKPGTVTRLKNYLSHSEAFTAYRAYKPGPQGEVKNELENHQSSFLCEVSLEEANFSLLRCFDANGELAAGWLQFCEQQKVPETFAISDSFKQSLFSNLDPRQAQKVQQFILECAFYAIRRSGVPHENLISFNNDNLVMRLGASQEDSMAEYKVICEAVLKFNEEPWPDALPENFTGKVQLKTNLYKLRSLGKGIFLRQNFEDEGAEWKYTHTSLIGVPSSQYYMYFKEFILEEEVEDRDLYFFSEGRLAKWVV